ncbi:MAG: glycosyltransferase family 2 protein [Kiritimatiellaeota bacterium]|nr:glycosyltransferase family 2 protein [Kiritimatiellota bacterium]
MKMKNSLCVVIPVYNEEKTVESVLDKVSSRPETAEVIIVDDASKDSSRELISKYMESHKDKKITLLTQERNLGKGAAIRRGFAAATAPIVIVQDADWEYSPDDYPLVLEPIVSGKADVVYGSRFQGGGGRVLLFRHMMGNKLITFVCNFMTNLALTDVESCYKVFKREVIQNINLETCRFGIEVEMTAKIAKSREELRIFEVPISYNNRSYEEGKKITWKDGVAAFWHMFKYNYRQSPAKFYKRPWSEVLPAEKNSPTTAASKTDNQ